MSMPYVWFNGSFVDDSEAHISPHDAGLLHGIGVFTTMRASKGIVQRLSAHLQRIRNSSEALSVPLIPSDEAITEAARELLTRNNLLDARLRLTVTRGVVTNDPIHGPRAEPTTLLTAAAFEPYPQSLYENGMTVMVLNDQKLNPYDVQAGHKTLDYFSRMNALRNATQYGAQEALWFNVHNYLQSGSVSNAFIVKAGKLITPPTNDELKDESINSVTAYPKSNVLPGTTRAAVIELAKASGIEVIRASISITDLLDADEVFLTNCSMNVMPVTRIERKTVGDEKPGRLTRTLADSLSETGEL